MGGQIACSVSLVKTTMYNKRVIIDTEKSQIVSSPIYIVVFKNIYIPKLYVV